MLVFDIETDGLLDELTTVHCVNLIDRSTGQRLRFNDRPEQAGRTPDGPLSEALRLLSEADEIAGHNIIGFDIPALQKVYPGFRPQGKVHDTLVYSRLIWTDIKDIDTRAIKRRRRPPEWEQGCRNGSKSVSCTGKHSLASWGYRLGDYKGDFAGPWDTFTPDMDDYCAQDVEVTLKLLEKIEAEGYSPRSLEIETRVAEIIDLQEKHGVLLDVPAAEALAADLTGQLAELDAKLREVFKPWYGPVLYKGQIVEKNPTRRVALKLISEDGEVTKINATPGHPYCPVKRIEFEPSSRDKIADRLIKLFDWQPQEFTKGGKPKVDDTTLDALSHIPEAALLKDYLLIAKRLGYLATGDKALLNMVGKDGRIHGRVNSNGAVTGRMTHFSPNMNVPKVKTDNDGNVLMGLAGGYGYELRSLFIVPPGKKLVGVDAEGLELRKLGHYMARYDGGAFVSALIDGNKADGTDAHSQNAQILGYSPKRREGAKRWMYAYLYGAGAWKLGFIEYDELMDDADRARFNAKYPAGKPRVNALSKLGAQAKKKIEGGLPALGALQREVQKRARRGFLRGLDGRKLRIRGMHAALNTLLQGGGAIVMKLALVLAYDAYLARGWQFGREFAFVLNVHDEFQIEAQEDLAEEIGTIAADAIRQAGEAFELRCPLAGSKDIGQRWSDTH